MPRIVRGVVCLVFASAPLLFAADCASLRSLQLPDTKITVAEPITSGVLAIADAGAPMRDLPAFCRVAGEFHPTSDSKIRFEVWLPAQGWNGRLLGGGNGGFAGSIYYGQLAGYLKRGFAVAATDAGHQAEGTDATWAYGHPEKVKDFGWRAIHVTAERAKQILNAYYGKPADKAYFDACSDGGREALMEAQRFPEDYDGILAGAPANAWSTMLAAGASAMQSLFGDPAAYVPDRKLPALQRAALAACDELDGVKDGVIGDPAKCRFDPQVLLCKGEDSADCLTQAQVDSVKALYGGIKDEQGKTMFPGYTMGDETSWKAWIVGEDPGSSLSSQFVQNYFRYMVADDPKMNVLTSKVGELLRAVARERGRRSRFDRSRSEPVCSARGQTDPLSRLERSCDLAGQYGCVLRERGTDIGPGESVERCSAVHDSRHGALWRRARSQLIWAIRPGDREGAEVRALRFARELGRKGLAE